MPSACCSSVTSHSAVSASPFKTASAAPSSTRTSTSSTAVEFGNATSQRADQAHSIKASTVHLPLKLPPPPFTDPEVDLTKLVLDPELRDRPVGFIVGRMRQLGTQLRAQASATKLDIPQTGAAPELPEYLTCRPPILSLESETFNPSHVLAIHAPDARRVLLLPVHGLLWASKALELSILSSRPAYQPAHPILPSHPAPTEPSLAEGEMRLPVVHLQMPSSLAFPLLQSWIYHASTAALLKMLLPPLQPVSPSLAPLMNREVLSVADEVCRQPKPLLLRHINLVHACWQDAVAIGQTEREYWETLARAWCILLSALATQEAAGSRKEERVQ